MQIGGMIGYSRCSKTGNNREKIGESDKADEPGSLKRYGSTLLARIRQVSIRRSISVKPNTLGQRGSAVP